MRSRPQVGTILSQTFSVFFGNLPSLGLITLIVLLPVMIAGGWETHRTLQGVVDPYLSVGVMLLSLILTPICTGALTYGVFQGIRGEKAEVGDCLRVGFGRMLPVLGLGLVVGILSALGAMLCLVPGLILMTMWSAAVPAAVIEKCGVMEALRRSSFLTSGHRWTVFGVLIVLWLIAMVLGMGVGFVIVIAFGGSLWIMILLQSLVTIVTSGLQATYPTVIYYHLRSAKETIDLDEIASVFD